ncbi:hypothetical protein BKA65DRAFT_595873 [Rhexocercosporidium sp. MPI-PUGE-AT-0058]|nr:hypothetical protein BKA65DRAFT_595873 [Rhexocercosporidium sp. MPI-PUGE-AT-0058]
MTRHSSKKKNATNIGHKSSLNVTIIDDSDDEPAPSPLPIPHIHRKTQKLKKKHSKQTKAAKALVLQSPEDSESDQDELGNEQQVIQKLPRKEPAPVDAAREKKVAKALEKAAKMLTSLGNQADVLKTLERVASRGGDTADQVQEHCDTILTFLATSPRTAQNTNDEVPSTIDLYDQYFAHQAPGKQLYILRPVEVFKGNNNLTRGKVAGFIQNLGSNFPLKYALPGWTPCVEDHPRLLDCALWTKEVQRWAEFHNHHFPTHPFDQYHGKAQGHACASHVEPRLMLWFACDRLRELRGIDKPIRVLLGELFRLRDYDVKMEAEVFLTRDPCRKCLEIKKLIEDYTRILFHIRVIPNLGELQPERNKHGWVTFRRYAQVSEDDQDEEIGVIGRQEVVEKTKSTFAVVIRGNPNTPEKQSSKHNRQELTPPSTHSSTVTKTSTITQKHHIQSFSYQPHSSHIRNGYHEADQESDSDVSVYEPPASSQRKPSKSVSRHAKTPNKDSYLSEILGNAASSDTPFGDEARRQAKLLKREREKKRRAQEDTSPSLDLFQSLEALVPTDCLV